MFKVACVYKSGGEYNPNYVKRLALGVRRNLSLPYKFVCLTDISREHFEGTSIDELIPLTYDFPGWWAKMELFRIPGLVLYFDLDTVITGKIDRLAEQIIQSNGSIVMLRGFYRQDQCSGIMGWNEDLSWIFEAFRNNLGDRAKFFHRGNAIRLSNNEGEFRGDQEWLKIFLRNQNGHLRVLYAQDLIDGIYSYKVHIQPKGRIPEDARIICFHGKPRPHEVKLNENGS